MSALIEGCFREAGEQGLDMREWILRWEQIKKERANAREKTSIQERANDTSRNAARGNTQ
jgi:hypothetical protein